MATVLPGVQQISGASPVQQQLGAQFAASKETGIAQARQASAQFLQDAKEQANQLGISVADFMATNPELYRGAFQTLMGGDANRANQTWEDLKNVQRSPSQILNRENE